MGNHENDPDKTNVLGVLSPGLSIGHYTIVEKIGGGGMGEVYLADDAHLRRQVALKFLPAHCCDNPDLKERFQREARAAGALNHPNILTIHDINEYRGRPYIVMEYFPGKALKALIREGRIPPTKTLGIAAQVLAGLECAHNAGIVHRDIKSDNIMIDERGYVKIVDFGLARIEQEAGLTQSGSTLGTVAYMSPEQAEGKTADHRADLFSFGVVLYELITGRLPFQGDNLSAIIYSILNNEPEDIARYADDVPSGLVEIVKRLLRKQPGDRYQNAAAVSQDIVGLTGAAEIVNLVRRREPGRRRLPMYLLAGMVIIIAVAAYFILTEKRNTSEAPKRKMIAVLPFENIGSAEDAYFTLGITDEIITHLAKLQNIGVISRSSVMHYRTGEISYPKIGDELGVEYVLEGSVRWDKSGDSIRIMINTFLTDVEDGTQLWGESYRRVLNDIFAIQSDIAGKLTGALNVTLGEAERQSIEKAPTENLDAYAYYLQGNDYFNRRDWGVAVTLYEKAINLDSNFALAYAQLSRAHSLLFWWYEDRSDRRLEMARVAAEKALNIDPNLPEANLAMGRYYYRGFLDYDRAMEYYNRALAGNPNSSDLLFAIGSVSRRQGQWNQAVDYFRHAVSLDPRAVDKLRNLSETYLYMRDFDSSLAVVDKIITLAPDAPSALALKSKILALGQGQFEAAKETLKPLLSLNNPEVMDILFSIYVLSHELDSALALIESVRHSDYFASDSAYWFLQSGEICRWAGLESRSRASYDSARIILEASVQERPEEAAYRSMLAVAYAGLGRTDEAIGEGLRATELSPVSQDALAGSSWRFNLLLVYLMSDKIDKAVEEIRYLLSVPSQLTVQYLQNHPVFDNLRESPIYPELISGIN